MSTDDESFHPLGKEWETELEAMLDDTEYDSDLGLEMAKDAMRVTKGELSEAEFHEMYHDDVMDEFGVDDRPTEEAFEEMKAAEEGTMSRMLSKFEGDGEDSRRDAMKKMGAGAAAVGLGAWGTADGGDPEPNVADADSVTESSREGDIQWGMAIDLERCDGCLSCVTACSQENDLDQGVNWMYILDYEEPRGGADTSRNRLVRPCQHCTDAPCEKVCPTTARHTRENDGLVLTDYDVCIGCRYCQVACPYGVNYFQWDEPDASVEEVREHAEQMGAENEHMYDERDRWVDSRAPRGVMSKCTMCPTRQDGFKGDEYVGTTACEEACPPDAIQFGDMNDPDSDPQTYVDNPSRGRALVQVDSQGPSADALTEELEGADDDLESVLEAAEDLDEEMLRVILAIDTVSEEMGQGDAEYVAYEQNLLEVIDVLEAHGLDLESEEVLVELRLADEPDEDEEFDGASESDAQTALENFAGAPESNFRLLEDIGTNPNVVYLGNEPGPNAEQVDGPVAYDDVGLTDNRKEVVDEGTVGDAGVSL
ncbi:4Fe-4S dicluster domain-containing protein [Natrarchaeobius halalkaliphilus]|uniref:4Fe-4S dicluster domain-containing protein n=1 Tax=Natrarchaeobius halalkaliphilus TaxID=1679091 RepID=A0A3N6MCU9_9EURY|nr:4Fe-4S ferredoxin N-terminal domain-containing protein [Natrarchaeobius halalkaliphilus]RQG91586.1 4Fe-4S dicluster domain-containing protein [Natrarchaeobius halalkaliphilus]